MCTSSYFEWHQTLSIVWMHCTYVCLARTTLEDLPGSKDCFAFDIARVLLAVSNHCAPDVLTIVSSKQNIASKNQ